MEDILIAIWNERAANVCKVSFTLANLAMTS